MNNEIYKIYDEQIPVSLKNIPQPPKQLYIKGNMPRDDSKILSIVGTRKPTEYGERIVKELILGLRGYNICIVSGLAIGIDGLAHRAAIDAGLQTIAFPGSGLDESVLYPKQHKKLADEIVYSGGALISELELTFPSQDWTFPLRNRLMAGISQATIVIEAGLPSGSLITSRLANEYGKDVGAVPGSIYSQKSDGPNWLLKNYAHPITSSADILELLGFERPDDGFGRRVIQKELFIGLSESERNIIELLQNGSMSNEQIINTTNFNAKETNETLSLLEIRGFITERDGRWRMV